MADTFADATLQPSLMAKSTGVKNLFVFVNANCPFMVTLGTILILMDFS